VRIPYKNPIQFLQKGNELNNGAFNIQNISSYIFQYYYFYKDLFSDSPILHRLHSLNNTQRGNNNSLICIKMR